MIKRYLVEARLKHPGCCHSGYDFTIYAKNKTEAIRRARKEAFNEGHNGRHDGPLTYTATELED